jgi:Mn2+/Fe2+ NRAMP family transporter
MGKETRNLWKKMGRILLSFGPAFFIIGYVIGTGSVTSMVVSGAKYGLNLSWALGLSCFFTYFLIVAISKLTIVSGNTLMYNFRKKFGKPVTLFIIGSLLISVTSSIIGIMGIISEVMSEWLSHLSSGSVHPSYILTAILMITFLLTITYTGKHANFLKAMTIMVAFMAIAFIATAIFVIGNPADLFTDSMPEKLANDNPALVIAGIVGTTMASVVLVSRSILVQEQNWQLKDLPAENRDAMFSMIMAFLVSLAIMICAAGTLFREGMEIENPMDMVRALEPLAGRFAMSLFSLGIIAAGLSSIFPNLLLFPWLIADYGNIKRDMKRRAFQLIILLIALTALIVPVFGGRPIWILIASQAVSPLVMPLLTAFLLILLNSKKIMGENRIGLGMNIALVLAFLFNCFMMVIAIDGFMNYFN